MLSVRSRSGFEEKIVVSEAEGHCLAPHVYVDTTLSFANSRSVRCYSFFLTFRVNLASISGKKVVMRTSFLFLKIISVSL